jgi:hypothetical protein
MGPRSKTWTVFARSNTGILVSNSTRGMDIFLRFFCVCVVLCVASGLATSWSPVKGVLSTVHRLRNCKWPRTTKAVEPLMDGLDRYEELLGSFRTRSRRKCCLNLPNFGCHPFKIVFFGTYTATYRFFYDSKAPWKPFSLMLSNTACDSLWMSDTVSERRPFSFIFNFGNKANSQGAKSGE